MKKPLHPADIFAGKMLRHTRDAIGMSQEELAKALRITFQQVQKYEKGINRISVSRLFDICNVLNVSEAIFFDRPDNPALGFFAAKSIAEEKLEQINQLLGHR
jgi:transcriptional regulator with XRE-family HTH domain